MSRLKDETLSIRTSAEIKQLLRLAAERERRSVASMNPGSNRNLARRVRARNPSVAFAERG